MDISSECKFWVFISTMFSIGKWRGGSLLEVAMDAREWGEGMGWHARSSHRSYSARNVVPINFAKFTGKHLCQSLFFLFFMFTCEFCEITKKTFSTEHHSRNRSRSSYGRCSIKIAVLTLRRFSFRVFHEILI